MISRSKTSVLIATAVYLLTDVAVLRLAALQAIAYWDGGAPFYRWIEMAFAQNRATPGSGPRISNLSEHAVAAGAAATIPN